MSNLQIKNVPSDVHEELRRRATLRRMTVRDYLLDLIARDQALPAMDDWLDAIEAGPPLAELPEGLVAELVREGRDETAP